jgi:hypothetical protein
MTIITHIMATAIGVQALNLRGRDTVLAFLFGVAVDIDHVIKAPFYLRYAGLTNQKDYYWRSSLQEPVAFLWIAPLCLFLGTIVPALFFAIHLAMDYSVGYEKMPFYPYSRHISRGWFTRYPDRTKELILLAGLACCQAYLLWARR